MRFFFKSAVFYKIFGRVDIRFKFLHSFTISSGFLGAIVTGNGYGIVAFLLTGLKLIAIYYYITILCAIFG